MNFHRHYDLPAEHAFLSPSKYHWINYDIAKVADSYNKFLAARKGTELHEFANHCVRLKQRLPKSKLSLNNFVNDAIGFRMTSEQPLVYSENAFGTADAIAFRDNLLRIHDLKTGISPVYMTQLEIYAAYFCLEYEVNPEDIDIELRIYQSNEIIVHNPDPKDIRKIMEKTILFDKKLTEIKNAEMEG